ncbi:hypothetical protein [Streptomyces odonnellii]|uniref:hypothetical protein n=1 Tax=Streptomyces odonnellii TaxID=1417980 RepID=UPI000B22C324|nr:hypothetical protein [Streptomyces odonnellii]
MPTFLIAVLLGLISGGGTYAYTGNADLAAIVGLVVFAAVWLGIYAIFLLDE